MPEQTPTQIATASAHIKRCLSASGSIEPFSGSVSIGATPLGPETADTTSTDSNRFPLTT